MYGGMSTEMWMSDSGESHPQVALQRRIWDELRAEPGLDTGALSVEVEGFVVTLAGSVPDYPSKLAVQRAAERIAGVRTVVNEITVRLREPDARTDSALAAAAANALVWDARVAHGKLCAYVLDGWVTLAGTVGHGAERAAAENAVENLTGIRGITNQIVVVPADSATHVKARAEAVMEDLLTVR